MTNKPTTKSWSGRTAYDSSGSKIGTVEAVYVDDETGRPTWFTVNTGWFGTSQSFVPIEGTEQQDDDLIVAFDKDLIKDAPRVDDDGHISPEEEARLFNHYRIADTSSAGRGTPQGTKGTAGTTSTPGTKGTTGTAKPTSDDAMTRSEERVTGRAEAKETGRARLRKTVETEHETVTVPVRKEKLRLEREPITDANRDKAMSGRELSEDEHEVVLHEEHAVVDKETTPVERVKVDKDVEVDHERVEADVRKEKIDLERDKRDRK